MSSPQITRRETLQWVAAALASSGFPHYAMAARPRALRETTLRGYGTDPDLNNPVVPWKRTMTGHQLQLTAQLADLILPATASAPAPSALGLPDFVDEWISAPYPEQQRDRSIILNGLGWFDAEAIRRWERPFFEVSGEHQKRLLGEAILEAAGNESTAGQFIRRFRFVVVGGYYSTPEGAKDIGYIGNVALQSFPPVSEDERAIIDAELRRLGIY